MNPEEPSLNHAPLLLVPQLTQLLAGLGLGGVTTISSHRELTPSLLICILERLTKKRLPLSDADREGLFGSNAQKVHGLKIFLGVLQADVVCKDVGLSALDPFRLARGEDHETLFMAQLLCWAAGADRELRAEGGMEERSGSPSTLTTRNTASSPLLVGVKEEEETPDTSVSADAPAPHNARCIHEIPEPSLILSPITPERQSLPLPPPHCSPPRCIHQVPSPPMLLSPMIPTRSDRTLSLSLPPPSSPSVRYTGHLTFVDEDAEIAAFEASRSRSSSSSLLLSTAAPPLRSTAQAPERALAKEHARTRHLTRQKADLLEQLARMGVDSDPESHPVGREEEDEWDCGTFRYRSPYSSCLWEAVMPERYSGMPARASRLLDSPTDCSGDLFHPLRGMTAMIVGSGVWVSKTITNMSDSFWAGQQAAYMTQYNQAQAALGIIYLANLSLRRAEIEMRYNIECSEAIHQRRQPPSPPEYPTVSDAEREAIESRFCALFNMERQNLWQTRKLGEKPAADECLEELSLSTPGNSVRIKRTSGGSGGAQRRVIPTHTEHRSSAVSKNVRKSSENRRRLKSRTRIKVEGGQEESGYAHRGELGGCPSPGTAANSGGVVEIRTKVGDSQTAMHSIGLELAGEREVYE
ncbi:hypothetical protein FB45DRAFT_1011701 [Roridomyces roridus]|uniref:Uncharacterized protein n=1 Tax=Roridomyces roridus TaxID=1738132 RepID=A0AAD7B0F2_9AGAR|nr:hypothetical protein FB45DRAFT_1011701 [Roridomyces roridus]